ncbi:jg26648 [Pararge aegeria aegeria]|uniref:Jg26648 protein n=1 Tax=Pararge aegeria aegeria TaxID=348720 RepID=A0A8S4QHS5_9NEOP|nr:jg26648 [Pararge aegeria aegeria]
MQVNTLNRYLVNKSLSLEKNQELVGIENDSQNLYYNRNDSYTCTAVYEEKATVNVTPGGGQRSSLVRETTYRHPGRTGKKSRRCPSSPLHEYRLTQYTQLVNLSITN